MAIRFDLIHIKIFVGDLLIFGKYTKDEKSYGELIQGLVGSEYEGWARIDQDRFVNSLLSTMIYVIAVEGLSRRQRDLLNEYFKPDNSYLGAMQIRETNKIHWDLYSNSLVPKYRYLDRELRLFYWGPLAESKDVAIEEICKGLPFKSVSWEDVGERYTIFDNYHSYSHARRLEEVSDMLNDNLSRMIDESLLRLGDLDPSLQTSLSSALHALSITESTEDYAHVAVSCRRFLEGLANYPPVGGLKEGRLLDAPRYRNRLWMFAQENIKGDDKALVQSQLQDLGSRIDHLDRLSNKGIHRRISLGEINRLLVGLILTTYDLLTMSPSPDLTPA